MGRVVCLVAAGLGVFQAGCSDGSHHGSGGPATVAGTFVKFEGTPWINAISFTGSSLVFDGTDNRFHAVLNGGGADGLTRQRPVSLEPRAASR